MRTLSLNAALFVLAGSLAMIGLPAGSAPVTLNVPPAKAPVGMSPGMSPGMALGMSAPGSQQSGVVTVQKFGAWDIRCLKAPPAPAKAGKKAKSDDESPAPTRVYAGVKIVTTFTCRAVAETHYNNNPLLDVRLLFLIVPEPPAIRVLAIFPPRFTLAAQNGPKLKLDSTVLSLRTYARCAPLECGASIQLPPARLGDFRKAKSIVLELPDLQNTKPFEYAIPAAGFPAAIDVLQKLASK